MLPRGHTNLAKHIPTDCTTYLPGVLQPLGTPWQSGDGGRGTPDGGSSTTPPSLSGQRRPPRAATLTCRFPTATRPPPLTSPRPPPPPPTQSRFRTRKWPSDRTRASTDELRGRALNVSQVGNQIFLRIKKRATSLLVKLRLSPQ